MRREILRRSRNYPHQYNVVNKGDRVDVGIWGWAGTGRPDVQIYKRDDPTFHNAVWVEAGYGREGFKLAARVAEIFLGVEVQYGDKDDT